MACPKKPYEAPESRKSKGKLAPRRNSSKVNQITYARRELQRGPGEVTSPRRQNWTRRLALQTRSDATGVRTNRLHPAQP